MKGRGLDTSGSGQGKMTGYSEPLVKLCVS